MIDHDFALDLPTDLHAALAALLDPSRPAIPLAGGQSLLVAMKATQTGPERLVDLSGVRELRGFDVAGERVRIGAMTRHAELELDPHIRRVVPLLAQAASAVADPQVRHLGTLGGSLCNADPAADLPAALVALRALVHYRDQDGEHVDDVETFLNARRAAARPLLVTAVDVPAHDRLPWAFQKFRPRAMLWAVVGVAYVGGEVPGIGLAGMGWTTLRAAQAESALRLGRPYDEVAALADAGSDPLSDATATADYRRHLARVLLRRALAGESTH
ncbi:FAD binding domain-containing protein [Actinomadura rugatobispora]|uniref:FAD binding domain-containing protein n=1 Tax=Actinomadura rugatobispora TaxID=1994 RepID=A0ABW0ZPY8_9ACTN|nr:xanthine dehydrogenase family protein subunit M [Actinomadura rugatobispora]